jgi:phosphohistidine swiveling domain-containing protein
MEWLHKAAQLNAPIVPTYLIDSSLLANLGDRATQHTLINEYHRLLGGDFVTLISRTTKQANIHGDANLIESLQSFDRTNPVFIQQQPTPQKSGFVFTTDEQHTDKTHLRIQACWGVWTPESETDEFVVSLRDWSTTNSKISPKYRAWQRQLDTLKPASLGTHYQHISCLDQTELSLLSRLVWQTKQSSLNHFQVEWQQFDQMFYFVAIEPMTELLNSQQAIVRGHVINAGYILGTCQVISDSTVPHLKSTGEFSILVLPSLKADHRELVKIASAFILNEDIHDPYILRQINSLKIPVLYNTKVATSKLKTGQKVVLYTSQKTVYQSLPDASSSTEPEPQSRLTLVADFTRKTLGTTVSSVTRAGFIQTAPVWWSLPKSPHVSVAMNKSSVQLQLFNHLTSLVDMHPTLDRWFYQLTSRYEVTDSTEDDLSGALVALQEPLFFQTELKAASLLEENRKLRCALVLPTIRTISELELLKIAITSNQSYAHFVHSLWAEITAPYLANQLIAHPNHSVQGLIVNAHHLFWQSVGINPANTSLTKHYPLDVVYLTDIFTQLKTKYPHQPIYARLMHTHPKLLDTLLSLHIDGIIVPAQESMNTSIRIQTH